MDTFIRPRKRTQCILSRCVWRRLRLALSHLSVRVQPSQLSRARTHPFAQTATTQTTFQPVGGVSMVTNKSFRLWLVVLLGSLASVTVSAQSFRVQCPTSTITHPTAANNNAEPAYTGPTTLTAGSGGYLTPSANVNGAIKCQQISGGDGYATMGDGTQTYMFSFGPLSGLADLAKGLPGTQFPDVFNTPYPGTAPLPPGDTATTVDASGPGTFSYNGAVGQVPDLDNGGLIDGHVDPRSIMDIGLMNGNIQPPLMAIDEDDEYFLTLSNVGMIMRPDLFEQHTVHFHGYPNASAFYDGVPDASVAINIGGSFT